MSVTGRYVLPPEIFEYLEATTAGAGGEIQLTDGLRKLAQREGLYASFYEGKTHDAGDKLGFLKATVEIALRNPQFGAAISRIFARIEIVISPRRIYFFSFFELLFSAGAFDSADFSPDFSPDFSVDFADRSIAGAFAGWRR